MSLTQAQLAALKTELQTDPRGYGYSAASRNDGAMSDKLKLVRDGTNIGPAITIREESVFAKSLVEAIDVVDYTALPASPSNAQLSNERRFLSWLACVTTRDNIRLLNDDGSDNTVIKNFKAMFAAGTGTMTRLTALASRNGNRAEELFGRGVVVTIEEVGKALN